MARFCILWWFIFKRHAKGPLFVWMLSANRNKRPLWTRINLLFSNLQTRFAVVLCILSLVFAISFIFCHCTDLRLIYCFVYNAYVKYFFLFESVLKTGTIKSQIIAADGRKFVNFFTRFSAVEWLQMLNLYVNGFSIYVGILWPLQASSYTNILTFVSNKLHTYMLRRK